MAKHTFRIVLGVVCVVIGHAVLNGLGSLPDWIWGVIFALPMCWLIGYSVEQTIGQFRIKP